jgi:hypothetical protein
MDRNGHLLRAGDRVSYTPVTRGRTVKGTIEQFYGDAYVLVYWDDGYAIGIATHYLVRIPA